MSKNCDWKITKGQIVGAMYNGKPSKLFNTLEKEFGLEQAVKMYELSRSTEFVGMFGEESNIKTLLNYITSENKSSEELSADDFVDLIETGVPDVKAFYSDLGIFTINEQKLKSAGYNSYEINLLKNDIDLQSRVKNAVERLQNTENVNVTPIQSTEVLNDVNNFGKLRPVNSNILQKEVVETLGGITDMNEFEQALNQLPYPNFQATVNKDQLFQEMQQYKKAEAYIEVNGEIRPQKNTETALTLPLVMKVTDNKELFSDLTTISELDLDILQNNEVETRQVLAEIEKNLLSEGLDVVGLKDKPIDEDLQLFLVPLIKFISNPTTQNTTEFSDIYDKYFQNNIEPKTDVVKSTQSDRLFVTLKTNLSEEEVYEKSGLVKAGENLWIKTAKEDLETLYKNVGVKREDLTLPQDFNNADNAEAVALYKQYFKIAQVKETVKEIKFFTNIENQDYLKSEFVSDFHIEHLKEKQKNSDKYRNFYSNFGVNKDGLYLINDDEITLEKIKLYADENLKNYSLLSKQMPSLKEMDINTNTNERDTVVNYPETADIFDGQTHTIGETGEIIAKNSINPFIRIGQNVYEKLDQVGNLSLYSQLPVNKSEYNVVGVNQPITNTDLSYYEYLENEQEIKFPENMFSIIGEKGAKELDKIEESVYRLENLEIAKAMEQSGKTPKVIRLATGWEKTNGQWKYEIADVKLKDIAFEIGKEYKYLEITEDGEFTKAYPNLEDVKVIFNEDGNTRYRRDTNTIEISPVMGDGTLPIQAGGSVNDVEAFFAGANMYRLQREDVRNFLHESHHFAQYEEGFYTGGSPTYIEKEAFRISGIENTDSNELRAERLNKVLDNPESTQSDKNIISAYLKSFSNTGALIDAYRNIAGEIEARSVEERMDMTPSERLNTLLSDTELLMGVSEKDKIFITAPTQNLKYKTPSGEIFNTYADALKNTNVGNISVGLNTVKGFKEQYSVSSDTNTKVWEGMVNNLIKSDLLSDKAYTDSKGRKLFVPAGNSLVKRIINSEIAKKQARQSFGRQVKTLANGDMYLEAKDTTKTDDFIGDLAVQAIKESTETVARQINIPQETFIPENKLQVSLLSLLKKMGVKTLSIADYVENYSKKNGVPPSAQALADLANRIVAFKDGIIEAQDLNEETSHFIIAATEKTEIENLKRNIHKTKQWVQHSKTYYDIYGQTLSGEELESAVREEILGKTLADFIQNRFDSETAQNETEKNILEKLKDIFNNFFNKIKDFFQSEYQTELDTYMDAVYNNIMNESLFDKLDLTQLKNRQLTLFSVDESKRSPLIDVYKKSSELLDVIYSQQRKLTKGRGQTVTNIGKIRELSEKEDVYSKIKALSAITAIAKKQVDQLERAAFSKKNGEFPFSQEENAVYEMYRSVTSQLLAEVKSLLTTADLSNLSDTEKNSIIKDQNNIAKEITAIQTKFSDLRGKVGVNENKTIEILAERTAIKHNLSDSQKQDLIKALEASQKDTAVLHAYLGSLVHARSPLLNLAGDVIANTTTDARQSFLKAAKPFIQVLEDAKILPKTLKTFKVGSYLRNDINNTELDNFENRVKTVVYNKIADKKVEKYERGLEDNLTPDQKTAFSREVRTVMSEVRENFFTDKYLKEQEEKFASVYAPALEYHKRDRAERAEIRTRATKDGLVIYDNNDKAEIEQLNRVRNQAASFYTPDGELKDGIIQTYNSETEGYEYSLTEEPSEEAKMAMGLKEISDVIQASFPKTEKGQLPIKFLEMFNEMPSMENKLDFLFLNAYVGFDDSFWENYGSNKTTLQKLEEVKTAENEDEISEIISEINKNQQKIRYIQKNNRVFNRPSETNVQEMSFTEKDTMREAVEDLQTLFSKANKFLTEDFQTNEDSLFTTTVNDSYLEELQDRKITSLEDKLTFIKENTTYQGKRYIDQAITASEGLKRGKITEVPFFLRNYVTADMGAEEIDNTILKFAESKLLPYYKRTEPQGFAELLNSLKDGSISLEEFSQSPLVKVSPNFSFYEDAVNENINPKFLENKEKGRLQIKKGDIKLKHELFKGEVVNFDDKGFDEFYKKNKVAYDALLALHKTTLENYGISDSHNIYKLPQVGKRGIRQGQELIQKWSQPSVWKEAIKDLTSFRQDELEFGQDTEGNAAVRKLNANIIPMYYTKDLQNQQDLSDELLYTYTLMNQQSALYKARVENLGDMLSVKKAILDTQFEGKSSEASNTYNMFKSFLDYNFYGIKENLTYAVDLGFTKVDVAKVLRNFIKFSSFVNLSGVVVPFTNVLQSTVNKTVEKLVGERLNPIATRLANREFVKLAPAATGEMLEINSKSKLNLIMEFFGQSEIVSGRFQNSNYNKFTRGLGKAAHATHEMSAFPTIPRTVLAVLMDNRYFNGKIYSYNDFKKYQKASGNLDLKDVELKWKALDLFYNDISVKENQLDFNKEQIGKKLDLQGQELEDYLKQMILGITSRAKIAVQDVDMAIPQEEKSMLARHSLSNLILQHSGWLLLASQRKFKEKHLNLATGLVEEGNWQTLGRFIREITAGYSPKNGKSYLQHVRDVYNGENLKDKDGNVNLAELESQRKNLARTGVELAVVNALFLMGYLLANMRSDDDKDKDLFDEAIDVAYYFTYRTANEVTSSTVALPVQYVGKVKSPVVSLQMMGEMAKFYNLFNSDLVERGRYAGETQRWRTMNKLIPFVKDYNKLANIQTEITTYKHFNEDGERMVALSIILDPDAK